MAIGERRKLSNKYRLAATTSVLAYIDTAEQLGQDPLGLTDLPVGTILLGAELEDRTGKKLGPNDSVWWVWSDPKTGKMLGHRQLGPDLSKWQRQLSRQLEAWGQKSAVRKANNKRARNAGLVASLFVAAAVAAGLITRSGQGEETALTEATWLGHENWVTSGEILRPAVEATSFETTLEDQAQAIQDTLPAGLAAAAEADATSRPKAHGLEVAVRVTGVIVAGVGVFGAWLLYKGYQKANEDGVNDDEN